MTEDDGKFEEWMYDFAWKGRDAAQQGINILDNKAMSLINFTGILITILTGVLFFLKDKEIEATIFIKASTLIICSILFFIIAIVFAFLTLWVRKHGILPIHKQFKAIDDFIEKSDKNIHEAQTAMGKTAKDIADWQLILIKLAKTKSILLKISSACFIFALGLIFISSLLISSYI